jgi:undecaprenyl-diphosphatase
MIGSVVNLDIGLLYYLNGINIRFLNYILINITNTTYLFIALIMLTLFLKNKKVFLNVFITIILIVITVYGLKYAVNEPRPYFVLSNIHPLVSMKNEPSFPSGHTALVFGLWTSLYLNRNEFNCNLNLKKYIILFLLIWACLVAFSRIYVGVHYPHDVVGGMIIGIGGAYVYGKLIKRLIY